MVTFTRYLYFKGDVEIALMGSILKKDKAAALFWAYELHFSGFGEDAKMILWKIYYSLYASQHVQLENYMKKKEDKLTCDADQEMFILTFVSNLIIRKYNTDAFMLAGVTIKTEQDEESLPYSFVEKLERLDYEAVCHDIHDDLSKEDENINKKLIAELTSFFKSKGCEKVNCLKKYIVPGVSPLLVLIARVMTLFTELSQRTGSPETSIKKNLYVSCKESEVDQFRTREVEYGKERPSEVFCHLVAQTPYTDGILSVFNTCADEDVLHIYRKKWLVHAHENTPVWRTRIEKFGGNRHDDQIVWQSDDLEEEFMERYYYDTDEQSSEIQKRNVPQFKNRMSLLEFYAKFGGSCIYEPCEEILEALVD